MIKVKDFMIKNVFTIDGNETAHDATGQIVLNNVSCLVVTDKARPIGFITEKILVKEVLLPEKDPKGIKIKDIMHKINTAKSNDNFFDLVQHMRKNYLRRVAVVDKGKLVGIVTETDLVKTSMKLQKGLSTKKDQNVMQKLENIQSGVRKMDTGYWELNHVLADGFPYNKSVVLVGPPGSGKGLIAFNFMKMGLKNQDKVLYLCMNEILGDIKGLFGSLGVDIDAYVKSKNFKLINIYEEVTQEQQKIYGDEDNLLIKQFSTIKRDLMDFIKDAHTPVRCVVNVISQSLAMYDAKTVYKFMLLLNNLLKRNGLTTLYFIHKAHEVNEETINMEEIMDGIIEIDKKGEGKKMEKTMIIKKMKPEFARLPISFSYDFDVDKELSLVRQAD